uniref:Peroxiredoxin-like 2A n=2 Tax=Oncorhynchus mykiss TaxID=8022 RepID=A0A8C7R7I3_ONCMY
MIKYTVPCKIHVSSICSVTLKVQYPTNVTVSLHLITKPVFPQRALYGLVERYMFLSALLRIGVWRSLWRAYRKGCTGNIIKGEGLVLGGVFVIGPEDQGILLEHREKEFGDKVNLLAVLRSARKIQDGLATAK